MKIRNTLKNCTFLLIGVTLLETADGQIFTDQSEDLGVTGVVMAAPFGSGLSTYDFNNDNLDDITLADSYGNIQFYKNVVDGFELIDLGISSPGVTKQVLWVDYDNDLDQDFLITTFMGQVVLFQNQGNMEFLDVTEIIGLPIYDADNTGVSFGDYDLDGDLDLYIAKYVQGDFNADDSTQYNRLYRNEGGQSFTDVTVSSGISMPPTWSFQPVWFDSNGDKWPDLYVINDREPTNFLFINDGNGGFSEAAYQMNMGFIDNDIMSNSMTDFDHDGDLDIYMTNTGAYPDGTHNMFAINNGVIAYSESAIAYNIGVYDFSWGALWVDADNDSWDDLLFVTPDDGPIYFYESQNGESFVQNNAEVLVDNHHTSYCPAKGDFNGDGFSDIAIQCEAPNNSYVLMNQGGTNDFIKITVHGTVSNKNAIGTWIKVYNGGEVISKYTFSGENYHGQNSQHHIFGLGPDVEFVDSVLVTYPSGHTDIYYGLPTGTGYDLTEGDSFSVHISTENGNYFCAGDSILITADSNISYAWSTGESSQSIWANASGAYYVEVQNTLGLTAIDSIIIAENPNPVISCLISTPLCFGDSTGTIELINQNGIAADSVIWNDGYVGNPNEGITAANYSFVFTDMNGCQSTGEATLIDPSAVQIFATSTPETDENEDGSISLLIFGGTPPYSIFLEGELVFSPIENLEAGWYTFTIIDANECIEEIEVEIDYVLTLAQAEQGQIRFFPNPVIDQLHIDCDEVLHSIHLLTLDGKIVAEYFQMDQNSISLKDINPGMYLLQVQFAGGDLTVVKFVKE